MADTDGTIQQTPRIKLFVRGVWRIKRCSTEGESFDEENYAEDLSRVA